MTITINGTVYEQKFNPAKTINCKLCDLNKTKTGSNKACHSVAEKHCKTYSDTMPYFKKKRVVKNNNNDNGQFSLF